MIGNPPKMLLLPFKPGELLDRKECVITIINPILYLLQLWEPLAKV
jgi:hypothetical protein